MRIEGLAREHGGEITDYQGVRLLTHSDGDDKPMALGFLEPGVLAVGSADAVRAAIDAKRSGRSVLSNTDLMRLVNDLDASNAWAVGRFDALATQADLPDGLHHKMPTLSWFSAAGHLNGGVSGTIKAEAKDDEAAANLRDMLRGVVAMVKLQTGDNPGLKAMADSLQLGGEGPHRGGGVRGAGGSVRRPRSDAPEERARGAAPTHRAEPRTLQRRTAGPRGPAVVMYRMPRAPARYGFSSRSAASASMKPAMACVTGSDSPTNSMPVR